MLTVIIMRIIYLLKFLYILDQLCYNNIGRRIMNYIRPYFFFFESTDRIYFTFRPVEDYDVDC